ncbi:MAG TPA: histidinol-phosphatase [Deltaproteobacteria bacterium]|nr:histidinol-phosphatase [Deltaproteobacteria bacterium]
MAENCTYAARLGKDNGVLVLSGMELQTSEELHLLAIFGDHEAAMELQEYVYSNLPSVPNNPDYFGDQVVVDEKDVIIRSEERLLLNSTALSINEAVLWIKERGGIVIPSHIDSSAFSIVSQLGYVPPGLPFDALEIEKMEKLETIRPFVMAKDTPLVTFSDAHYLKDIGRRRTLLEMERPSYEGVVEALGHLPTIRGGTPYPC